MVDAQPRGLGTWKILVSAAHAAIRKPALAARNPSQVASRSGMVEKPT